MLPSSRPVNCVFKLQQLMDNPSQCSPLPVTECRFQRPPNDQNNVRFWIWMTSRITAAHSIFFLSITSEHASAHVSKQSQIQNQRQSQSWTYNYEGKKTQVRKIKLNEEVNKLMITDVRRDFEMEEEIKWWQWCLVYTSSSLTLCRLYLNSKQPKQSVKFELIYCFLTISSKWHCLTQQCLTSTSRGRFILIWMASSLWF